MSLFLKHSFQYLIEEYEKTHGGDTVPSASGSEKKKVSDGGKRKAEDEGKSEKSAKKPDTRCVVLPIQRYCLFICALVGPRNLPEVRLQKKSMRLRMIQDIKFLRLKANCWP